MNTVAVVDLGIGNLFSVCNAFRRLGATAEVIHAPDQVMKAERIVLPGVGAAPRATSRLFADGLDEALTEAVRIKGRPFLGICLGMQLLARRLDEFDAGKGLGWIEGDVVHLQSLASPGARVPHMGWNGVDVRAGAEAFFPHARRSQEFYFAHSYTLVMDEGADGVATTTEYEGAELVSAIRSESILATQFHPEKSQHTGEELLQAFLEWTP